MYPPNRFPPSWGMPPTFGADAIFGTDPRAIFGGDPTMAQAYIDGRRKRKAKREQRKAKRERRKARNKARLSKKPKGLFGKIGRALEKTGRAVGKGVVTVVKVADPVTSLSALAAREKARGKSWKQIKKRGFKEIKTTVKEFKPIAQAGLAVASLTPLAPIALPASAGLAAVDAIGQAASGKRPLNVGTLISSVGKVAAGAVGIPSQAVDVAAGAASVVQSAARGERINAGSVLSAASHLVPVDKVPLGATIEKLAPIATKAAKGDVVGAISGGLSLSGRDVSIPFRPGR